MATVWLNVLVALLLIATLNFDGTLGGHSLGSRNIVRGTPVVWPSAGRLQFPYMATLHAHKQNFCGAVIIKPGVALTAAHCVKAFVKTPEEVVIRAGTIDLLQTDKTNVQKKKLKKIKLHENASKFGYDIAVIYLAKPFVLDRYVQKVNLPTLAHNGKFAGKTATAIGFGYTETGEKATRLQQANLKMIGFQGCKRTFHFLDPSMICIGGGGNQNVCHGDSGGPVVQHFADTPSRDVLIGITSYVINSPEANCDPEFPATAVNIPLLREWIDHWAQN